MTSEAAIVGIGDSHAVGGAQPLLGGKAAAGEYRTEVAVGDGYRKAGTYLLGRVRRYCHTPAINAGVEVVTRRLSAAARGQGRVFAQLLYVYQHKIIS